MIIKIRVVEDVPRKYTRGGRWINGRYFSNKSIFKSKWLTNEEKAQLLDMSAGVKVKKVKKVKRTKSNPRPIAKYYIDGTLYCDGSVIERTGFYGV